MFFVSTSAMTADVKCDDVINLGNVMRFGLTFSGRSIIIVPTLTGNDGKLRAIAKCVKVMGNDEK